MKRIIISVVSIILIASCSSRERHHACVWDTCPYKGRIPTNYKQAVMQYTSCEEGTDCYYIDMLHLEFPTEEYDKLEDRLFKNMKPVLQPKQVKQVFIKQCNVDSRGFISVRYISTDGEEYAYDYMTQDEFQSRFGFIISTEE